MNDATVQAMVVEATNLAKKAYLDGSPTIVDLKTLAGEYVSEHPADDNEAVTEEWLGFVGFKDDNQGAEGISYLWINNLKRGLFDLSYDRVEKLWTVGDSENTIALPAPATRGDLRHLCKVLGINLKEAAA